MSVRLTRNLYVGPLNIFPNFWHWYICRNAIELIRNIIGNIRF